MDHLHAVELILFSKVSHLFQGSPFSLPQNVKNEEKDSYERRTAANTISDKEACLLLLPELTNPLPLFFPPSLSHPLSVATAVSHAPYPDSPQHSTASLAWHCTRCADGEQLQPITSFESGVLFLSHHLSKPTL